MSPHKLKSTAVMACADVEGLVRSMLRSRPRGPTRWATRLSSFSRSLQKRRTCSAGGRLRTANTPAAHRHQRLRAEEQQHQQRLKKESPVLLWQLWPVHATRTGPSPATLLPAAAGLWTAQDTQRRRQAT